MATKLPLQETFVINSTPEEKRELSETHKYSLARQIISNLSHLNLKT